MGFPGRVVSGFQFRAHRAFPILKDAPGEETVLPPRKGSKQVSRESIKEQEGCVPPGGHTWGVWLGRKCAFQARRTQGTSSQWDLVPPPQGAFCSRPGTAAGGLSTCGRHPGAFKINYKLACNHHRV